MTIWRNCTIHSFYGDGEPMETSHCEVTIDDGRISVKYKYGADELQSYEGSEMGQGHFNLRATIGDGKASLHQFPNGRILDGWWVEDGAEGMWRIILTE